MSDHRDARDPSVRSAAYEATARRNGDGWAWVAGAAFLVVALAVAFGTGYEPRRTASIDMARAAPRYSAPQTVPALAAAAGSAAAPDPSWRGRPPPSGRSFSE